MVKFSSRLSTRLFLLMPPILKFCFWIHFNMLKLVTETFHYFSGGKKDYAKKKKNINFSFLKLFVLRARRILDYLNIVLNDLAFSHIFLTYRANIDYPSEHLLISNSKWRFFVHLLKKSLVRRLVLMSMFLYLRKKLVHFAFKKPLISHVFFDDLILLWKMSRRNAEIFPKIMRLFIQSLCIHWGLTMCFSS